MLKTAYGFDPAFRHGALIYANFELNPPDLKDRLIDFKVTYAWSPNMAGDPGMAVKSPPQEVFRLVQNIVSPLRQLPVHPMAIDWDPQSVYWKASKIQIVQLGLFLGYFTRALHELGFPVIYINPGQVRESLGLNKKTALKEILHEWFYDVVDCSGYEAILNLKKNTDYLDATILAYLTAKSTTTGGQYSWQFLTSPA